jgi:hypothetical protein
MHAGRFHDGVVLVLDLAGQHSPHTGHVLAVLVSGLSMGGYFALVVSLILLEIWHSRVRWTKRDTPRTRACPLGRDSPD